MMFRFTRMNWTRMVDYVKGHCVRLMRPSRARRRLGKKQLSRRSIRPCSSRTNACERTVANERLQWCDSSRRSAINDTVMSCAGCGAISWQTFGSVCYVSRELPPVFDIGNVNLYRMFRKKKNGQRSKDDDVCRCDANPRKCILRMAGELPGKFAFKNT